VAQFIGPLPDGNYMVGRVDHTMQFGSSGQPSYIVLHTIGGTVGMADLRFKNPSSEASAHYGVALDGTVVQWVGESDTAYHAGSWDMDLASIGIEHEDGGQPDAPRSDALYSASSALVREICLRYAIPISRDWIIKHQEVPNATTTCPGTLDVERIVSMATGTWDAGSEPVPAPEPTADPVASSPSVTDAFSPPANVDTPQPSPSPAPDAPQPSQPPPPGPDPATQPAQQLLTGEPLRDLATALYGDAGRLPDIYRAIQGIVAESIAASQPTTPPAESVPPPPVAPAAPAPAVGQGTPAAPPAPPAQQPPLAEKLSGGSQGFVFGLQIIYLAALGALAGIYFTNRSLINLPETLGPLPVAVPWFGALGAVLISLVGVTEHRRDWDQSYRFWHWSRPVLGASFGAISVLIFEAGILAVGSTPTASTQNVPRNLLYFLAAFVVGYREETFRELIKRLTDIIFSPGPIGTPGLAVSSMSPPVGPAAGGTALTLLGTGLTDTDSVRFGSAPAQFHIDGDTQVTVTSPPGQAGAAVSVVVTAKSATAAAGPFTYT
jgi:hypothetical protein